MKSVFPKCVTVAAIFVVSAAGVGFMTPTEALSFDPASFTNDSNITLRDAFGHHQHMALHIELKPTNMNKVHEELKQISDPDSPRYLQYYTLEEVQRLVQPKPESFAAVRGWLHNNGIHHDRHELMSHQFIRFNATFDELEQLIDTKATNRYFHIAIPTALQDHVALIRPADSHTDGSSPAHSKTADDTKHEAPPPPVATPSTPVNKSSGHRPHVSPIQRAGCWNLVTRDGVRGWYHISDTIRNRTQQKDSHLPVAIVATGGKVLLSDLVQYNRWQNTGRPSSKINPKISYINYPHSQYQSDSYNGEATWDTEIVEAIAPQLDVGIYVTNWANLENILDAIDGSLCHTHDHQCGGLKATRVLSFSVASPFQDADGRHRICDKFGKLSLAGTTFVHATGDTGVGGDDRTRFYTLFPAECTYSLAVGGTVDNGDYKEQAWGPTGGGFSDYFSTPDYQVDAMKYYYEHYNPGYDGKLYNNSQHCRGIPDVAAFAAIYPTTNEGGNGCSSAGTSISAPTWAGIVAMINNERFARGKGPVGFMNPSIYHKKFKDAFNDITIAGNEGVNHNPAFNATPGWDPTTGLGTPILTKLVKHFVES